MKNASFLLCLLTCACVSAPPSSPEAVASSILDDIDQGEINRAEERFDRVAKEAGYTDKMYPVLYDAARESYEGGKTESAVKILRFSSKHYPDADSMREALLWSLFVQRAEQPNPDPDLVNEIGDLVEAMRESPKEDPHWIELIATQQAIDSGQLSEAKASWQRFRAGWDGEPSVLLVYADDLERYLNTH